MTKSGKTVELRAGGGGAVERCSPVVSRHRLVAELRRLRESSGQKAVEVARELGWSTSKISRLENGQILPQRDDVTILLDHYDVSGERRELLKTMAVDAEKRGWWDLYSDTVPDSLITYIGLEAGAASMATWHHYIVPGMLQTADYARIVNGLHKPVNLLSPGEVERRTQLRMQRQALLDQEPVLRFLAVIDQSVLFRRFGDQELMRNQLRHVLDMARLPNVSVRILALAGPHSVDPSTFVILRFPPLDALPNLYDRVVYLEDFDGQIVEEEAKAYDYEILLRNLVEDALNEEESLGLIADAAGE
jgi:transcriptional regulator with XRE-family HTH domain